MSTAPFRIGISGSYGGLNIGDEAILESILVELRRRVPARFLIFSRDELDTVARHGVERAVDVRRLSRPDLQKELASLDLLILGGGGLLFDGEASGFVRPLLAAEHAGVATMTWAIGAGPLRDPEERLLVRAALSPARLISVRDESSRLLLENLGLAQDVRVVPDPALLLEAESFGQCLLEREGIEPGMRVIGMSVREQGPAAPDLDASQHHELLANTVDYVVERMEATVLFVPMERQDRQLAHGVASRVRNVERVLILKGNYSPRQIRGLMERLDFVIGMRLHFLIFAASARVPFVALPYGPKVAEFAKSMGMPLVPISNAGQLLAAVDRAWDCRAELERTLEMHVADAVQRARDVGSWVEEILRASAGDNARGVSRASLTPVTQKLESS